MFIIDEPGSEYLEEGEPTDEMEVLEDSESVMEEDVGNDDITESLRVNIYIQIHSFKSKRIFVYFP